MPIDLWLPGQDSSAMTCQCPAFWMQVLHRCLQGKLNDPQKLNTSWNIGQTTPDWLANFLKISGLETAVVIITCKSDAFYDPVGKDSIEIEKQ